MTALTGAPTLARLMLRRDRVVLPAWVLLLGVLPAVYASSFASLYPTAAARQAFAAGAAAAPVEVALLGRVFASSVGGLTAWRCGFVIVLLGLATLLSVVRHTRAEEEAGRAELIGAAVVGRYAPLAAALLVTLAADLAVGVLATAGLVATGLGGAGSVAMGLSLVAGGWFFAGAAAVAAQVTTGARTARGLAGAVLALAFVLRAAGDAADIPAVAALSPLGWLEQVRPYAGNRWLLLAGTGAAATAVVIVAAALFAWRDLGAGLLPSRAGPATTRGLGSPLALAWRLQRGTLLAWTVGYLLLGAVFGGIARSAAEQIGGSGQIADMVRRLGGTAGLADAFVAATMGVLGLATAGYAISATLRLHGEEVSGRAEPVLATAVSRLTWAGSHLVFGLLGPVVLLLAAGLAAGATYGVGGNGLGRQLPRVVAGALVQLPAVWVLTGGAVALFGLLPRFAALAWAVLAGCLLLGQVGPVLRLAQPVLDLSPFTHLPRVPGGPVHAVPLLVLTALAAALGGAGLLGLRRRDIG